MNPQAPVVIVGTGLAGYSLVREIRKQDKTVPVVMVTSDDGVSYSKPMLSTGFTKDKTADGLAQASASAMEQQLGIELRTHTRVTAIDSGAHQLWLGEECLDYSALVLAWGAEVIQLDLAGDARVYAINDLEDYRAFREALSGRQRVAILGAGLIGCEFANDLRNGGYEVDVIAPSATAMPGLLPTEAAAAVVDALAGTGVRFHFGTHAERVERHGDGVRLSLANGEQVAADLVISAVGLRPRTALARNAGLETDHGIVVNRALETSAADVYALGDCAQVDGQVLMYVLPLMACARALARTLCGERTEVSYGTMPVMIKTPSCPTAVAPPAPDAAGEWRISRDGNSVRALFEGAGGELLGFAVTGDYALEKQALAKQVPPIHG